MSVCSGRVEELPRGHQAEAAEMSLMEEEDPLVLCDLPLGTVVLLPDNEPSLSSQIIANYFSSDGPNASRRRTSSSEYMLTDVSSDGSSSGMEEDEPAWVTPCERYGGANTAMKDKAAVTERYAWGVNFLALLAFLVLAHWLCSLFGLVPVVLNVDL